MLKDADKLVELRTGKGLDTGVAPSVLPSAGAVWRDGKQVWFGAAHIEQALGSKVIIEPMLRRARAMAQAYVDGKPRLYYENLGVISYYQDNVDTLLGALNTEGSYDMVPWGNWLALTDNIGPVKLWKGVDDAGFIPIGETEFARAKILKKLGQYLLAFSTDVYPQGFHWSDASDPETWVPTVNNTAGNLPIRDLDSDIIAVADLGPALAMYSREYMMVVSYVGWPEIFGTPTQALSGIGAVSKHSIVSLGKQNWGLSKAGIFTTDGTAFEYVDKPLIHRWIQDNVDWARVAEITSYWDEQMGLAIWSLPTLAGPHKELGVDPKNKSFTFLGDGFGVSVERGVFDYPVVSRDDGIYFNSIYGLTQPNFYLASQLWAGPTQARLKSWDHMIVEGECGEAGEQGAEIRVGFANQPRMSAVEWLPWEPFKYQFPFGPRESIFLAVEFRSPSSIKIAAITVFGKLAGAVA